MISLLGVEASDDHKAVLRSLGNGECVFRDLDGRAGRIGVDLMSEDLARWLDTNPTRTRPEEPDAPRSQRLGAASRPRAKPGAALRRPETDPQERRWRE